MNAPFERLGPIARGRAIKRAYSAWLQQAVNLQGEAARFYAITLTLRQGMYRSGTLELLDRDKTSMCLRRSLDRLNSAFYRNAYRRYKKKLLCFPSIERGKLSGRWHVHMILQVPDHMHGREFVERFSKVWRRNEWSHEEFDIVPLSGRDVQHWTKYCLKDVVMDDETVDVPNLHLPS